MEAVQTQTTVNMTTRVSAECKCLTLWRPLLPYGYSYEARLG